MKKNKTEIKHIGDKKIEVCSGCYKGRIEWTFNGSNFILTKGIYIFCKNCGVGVERCTYGCNPEEVKKGYDCGLDNSGVY